MLDFPKTALILAAGLGTRLAPISHYVPKPLFPILTIPAIEIVIERLQLLGVQRFYINAHHLSQEITTFCTNLATRERLKISVFCEAEILGTAGGLGNLFAQMDEQHDTVIVHNADILETFDLVKAYGFHKEKNLMTTLLCVDEPSINTVQICNEKVVGFGTDGINNRTYSGVSFFEPAVLKSFPSTEFSTLTNSLKPFVSEGLIGVYESLTHEERFIPHLISPKHLRNLEQVCHPLRASPCPHFVDFGTPSSYMNLHRYILQNNIISFSSLKTHSLYGFVCIGRNVHANADVCLHDCVVWDNTCIPAGTYSNCIVTPFGILHA